LPEWTDIANYHLGLGFGVLRFGFVGEIWDLDFGVSIRGFEF